jgi:HSP20 family molecular chaperone IbpA
MFHVNMNELQKDLIKLQPMMESFLSEVNCGREGFCSDGKRTGTETTNDSIWSYKLNLANFPTKPENLNVKCENENLIISGTSETEKDQNGFKVFSNHVWSKEIKIPTKIEKTTIKAKLGEKNILNLMAEFKKEKETEIEIELD